jgi:hypothetical protein
MGSRARGAAWPAGRRRSQRSAGRQQRAGRIQAAPGVKHDALGAQQRQRRLGRQPGRRLAHRLHEGRLVGQAARHQPQLQRLLAAHLPGGQRQLHGGACRGPGQRRTGSGGRSAPPAAAPATRPLAGPARRLRRGPGRPAGRRGQRAPTVPDDLGQPLQRAQVCGDGQVHLLRAAAAAAAAGFGSGACSWAAPHRRAKAAPRRGARSRPRQPGQRLWGTLTAKRASRLQ